MSSTALGLALIGLLLAIGYALGVAAATPVISGCPQPHGSPSDLIAGLQP